MRLPHWRRIRNMSLPTWILNNSRCRSSWVRGAVKTWFVGVLTWRIFARLYESYAYKYVTPTENEREAVWIYSLSNHYSKLTTYYRKYFTSHAVGWFATLTLGEGKLERLFTFRVLPKMSLYEQGTRILPHPKIAQSLLSLSFLPTYPHGQGSWAIPPRFHSTMTKGTQPTVKGETDTISNHILPQNAAVTSRLTSHQTEPALRVFIRQAASAQPLTWTNDEHSVTVVQCLKHTLIIFVIPWYRQSRTCGRSS